MGITGLDVDARLSFLMELRDQQRHVEGQRRSDVETSQRTAHMSPFLANPSAQADRGTLADWTLQFAWDSNGPRNQPIVFLSHPHWFGPTAPQRDDRRQHPIFPEIFGTTHTDPIRNDIGNNWQVRDLVNQSHMTT